MTKKARLLSTILVSIFGINSANNFINANEINFRKQIVNAQKQNINNENSKPVQEKFDRTKAIRIGVNSMKLIIGLTGLALPIAGITYDIKKNSKKSEKNKLKQAIKDYETACPNIKKLYDELNSAFKLKKSTPGYNDSDPKFNEIRLRIANAKTNWNNQTGVLQVEKLAKIRYNEEGLDLIQAHELLEKLEQESSDLSSTSSKIGFANNIYRIFEPIFR